MTANGLLPSLRQDGGRFLGLRAGQHLGRRLADVPDDAAQPQQPDDVVTDVDLPPEEALVGRTLVVMVIVVPALAERDDGDERVVAAVVLRGVAAPAEQVT